MLNAMLAVIRYSVPGSQADEFAVQARAILDVLAAQPGYLRGQVGRSVDEPVLWALVSEWEGAGFYRRALSAARMAMYPLMTLMINEPSAFEGVYGLPDGGAAGSVGKA
ncbi:hypothetical protein GCM10009530_01990 [Microbispora corallina]|uniref:ABM domain-containing protein n=2 Tax=Streptosporangiaceae TaxID=2004 RepID=A0ABQ4FRX9_9ACTN|nr:antibiotic biosynthesis monooxygenase [Microbispora sp. ATCC PTA-5024]GIH37573.1 hypothetical protein Mco01_05730 [Microbispora corallina]